MKLERSLRRGGGGSLPFQQPPPLLPEFIDDPHVNGLHRALVECDYMVRKRRRRIICIFCSVLFCSVLFCSVLLAAAAPHPQFRLSSTVTLWQMKSCGDSSLNGYWLPAKCLNRNEARNKSGRIIYVGEDGEGVRALLRTASPMRNILCSYCTAPFE